MIVTMNVPCIVEKDGGYDIYGQKAKGARHPEKCAVVKLVDVNQHTTVRTDSGATRGHADENVNESRILLGAKTKATIDDVIEIGPFRMKITRMRVRYNVMSRIDHYEADGEICP